MPTRIRPKGLPDYEHPPIDEVAIAIQFKELSNYTSIHQGSLFETFKNEFPNHEIHPPLDLKFETFGRSIERNIPSIKFLNTPPAARLWFISDDNHRLIQFQPNRFISNWRKITGEGDYPHFEVILPEFFGHLASLKNFMSKSRIGKIEINQCELSYFNNIEMHEGEKFVDAFSRVFKFWNPIINVDLSKSNRLEGEACQFIMSSKFFLNTIDDPIGRLHIQAGRAIRADTGQEAIRADTGQEIIKLDLVVRGRPLNTNKRGLERFYLAAREAIVKTFDAITTDECHDLWKRK